MSSRRSSCRPSRRFRLPLPAGHPAGGGPVSGGALGALGVSVVLFWFFVVGVATAEDLGADFGVGAPAVLVLGEPRAALAFLALSLALALTAHHARPGHRAVHRERVLRR